MNWYLGVLKKYAVFSGRARRKEFWMFELINFLIIVVLCIVDMHTGTIQPVSGLGLLSGIYSLAVLIPSLAVSVRRLHDTDRSGWWLLLGLIPLVGSIILLVFFCLSGTPGENRFGPDPKAA
ncbi:MAG TPA: DUF805 domain-containing protein [Povalibacter sp.]|nr:DUF805 domain-containing protein [Povalibacter sp.]